jgi:hypothetical protein
MLCRCLGLIECFVQLRKSEMGLLTNREITT